ncbi:glycine betaine/proline transport system ATP-binding protein [Dongia mobilis]|uniref:Trimethylamine N-oxide transport system ATP-binding protein TmoW n=1 Tax=Dongia mobilis TaxID=578943 RepID=A0A4R6WJ34_9PROT|nr:choline ABC transporter ATP-binding protein [Dongia mobilis]TDQ77684.1 glycine betaine/proline transport system ATP-binding protein [Dongia mobilis]
MTNVNAVRFESVDVVFGQRAGEAIALMDQGEGRDSILEKTGSLVAVHDASLFVNEGEILVLMGLSGSGKSSLLRCVNGLNKVSRGRVMVKAGEKEVDVASCAEDVLREVRRNRISMVFQQFALMPWLTVRDNVGFGLDIRGTPKAERDRLVQEKIDLVRLGQFAEKFPHELSGGMQQRVGLARSFATEAEILLMDEPFSALDPLIREHLQDELIELQRNLKKTIIFVSHDLDEALKIGTRIAIMEAGRVVQFAVPEEIILNPVNDYVRQFVASMNPLTVLKGGTLMRPADDLVREPGSSFIQLDRAGRCRCQLDSAGRPNNLMVNGRPGQFVQYSTELDLAAAADDAVMITGSDRTPMRAAVTVRQLTKRPLVLLGDDGALLGVVGEHELYRGMLRQTEAAKVNVSGPNKAVV